MPLIHFKEGLGVMVIAIVGVCASGKTTLVQGLKTAGFNAYNVAQEHSCIKKFWNKHDILRDKRSEIGLATVYRSLELLCSLSILQKMDFGDGRSRYEVTGSDPAQHQHHHLICLQCGEVKEFADDLLEPLETDVADKSHFQIVDHQVKFYGYCQECQKKRED